MRRLIDANELRKEFEWLESVVNGCSKAEVRDTIQRIDNAPTVDAVEVVRCKDCKYAENMMPIDNGNGYLMGDCTLRKEDDIIVTAWEDEFCSYGERRSNGK